MAGPWEEYQADKKPTTKEREAEVGVRKSTADATIAESRAPYAARNAAADATLSEANARRAAAQAAALEAKMAAEAEANAAKGATAGRDRSEKLETLTGYLGTLQRARDVISSGAATGVVGQVTGGVWGTPAADLKGILESIANPVVLEAMAEARKGSAVGATGFGALSQKELELLKGKFGSLRQSQDPESLMRTINEIEQSYRRLTAYNAGYDPYTPEGAKLVGLPVPEGAEEPVPMDDPAAPMEIVPKGETVSDPELAGVNAAITSMVTSGRSADQIRAYLNEVRPGVGDKVLGVEEAVANFQKTGKPPRVNVEDTYVPGEETLISKIGDSPIGAGAMAMADQFASGFMGELAAGEMSGEDYNRTSAVMRGLREKYPGASLFGDLTGGTLSTVGGGLAAGKMGLKLPGLLEGVVQEGMYGIGSSEPGQRVEGGLYGAALAPATNLFGKLGSDAVGGIMRGSKPERAVLAEKYGINLTPGQLTGREATERNIAGLPVLGPQVAARRNETLEQFNQAAFDDALKPIGGRVSGIGQQGIAEAQEATAKAYRDALDGVTLHLDRPFIQKIRGRSYSELSKLRDIGPELTKEVDDIFTKYVDPQNGNLTGENLQNALQELQSLKQAYKQDPRWAKRIGPALDDISDGYSGLLQRQAPENFGMFNRANEAYRNVSILERAVENAPGGDVFGPGNLRAATKLGTQRFGGKKASARGDRPFNELVMNALGVIPEKVDDASLLGRFVAPAAGATGFGAVTGASMLAQPENDRIVDEGDGTFPPWLLAAVAGGALGSLPYSRRGVRTMGAPLLGPRTDSQRTLGQLIQNYGPAALRGAVRPTEPDAPMPQNFDYGQVGSPELRRIIQSAAAGSQPLTPEERTSLDLGGFVPTYGDVPAEGASPMSIDGRPIERDPETGVMVYSDTGEPVPGYRKGGKVTRPFAVRKGKKPLTVIPRRKARG